MGQITRVPAAKAMQVLPLDHEHHRPGHVDEQSGRLLLDRGLAAFEAGTGTGRASGFQGSRLAEQVKASSAVRPSRPVISTAAMSLVLSCARPGVVDLHLAEHSHDRDEQTRLRERGERGPCGRRGRPAPRRTPRGQPPAAGAAAPVVAREAGIRDGAHAADRSRRAP